jgi:hypothetical protein
MVLDSLQDDLKYALKDALEEFRQQSPSSIQDLDSYCANFDNISIKIGEEE